VAALWITIMKEDLSRDEFYKVINEQERVFKTGKAFNKAVAEFKYWEEEGGRGTDLAGQESPEEGCWYDKYGRHAG